jgi:lipopolysaccharide/colanic/teichoic acid biosynthesis glycosyltransferase/glycosyltransferase involved in cell wall biosynthesis
MPDSSLQLSVIVPAKDAATTIVDCLHALTQQQGYTLSRDYEIILVDDGSRDNTARIAEDLGVRVIRQANAGPAAARNTGVGHALGDLVCFTDADSIPTPDWLTQITAPFKHPEVVGVKGAYLCREKHLVPRFVQQEFEYKYQALTKLPKIDFIDTYSAAYRKNIFLENGGFDPRFPVPSVEDQEFSFRLARKGYRLAFQPAAKVYHRHDLDLWQYIRRKWGIGYWKAFMLRWLPEKTLSDSYTPASQRAQILLTADLLVALGGSIFYTPLLWLALAAILVFLESALSFLKLIRDQDRRILLPAIPLLFTRSAALGFGLLAGLLFPPRLKIPPRSGLTFIERLAKRLLDIFASIAGLILFSPVLLLASIFIRLDSPGKAIFSQERIGENGKPFRIYKLRTMLVDAQQKLQQVLEQNNIQLDQPAFKIPHDQRVTRVGRFLRRWSLDEVPQFWNILRGEMSLVGPRPEESWVVALYNDHQRQRLAVKPGLTGPMQVSGRGDLDLESRLAVELDYIQHYTFWLDLKIIWKSLGVIISGKGAY